MKILDTEWEEVRRIELEPYEDERGFFARTYCVKEFQKAGIECEFVQDNLSYNRKKNTIRGLHWQSAPFEEDKLVRCIAGAIYDVIVDIRPNSPTFLAWYGWQLTAENQTALLIPKGFAHGYQTLTDHAMVYYKVSQYYQPQSATGLRYNDPQIGVTWMSIQEPLTISAQDAKWELLK